MKDLRIVFMGTPDFAVGILDAIYQAGYTIVGVITAVDKPAGRGQKLKHSAVKTYALEKGLHIMQPALLKSEDFLSELRSLQANLQVVVAFRMLPELVWSMPEYGTFNLHASLLPDYRGAAPINWALINGESKTGVTTFFIDEKIDTGAIILKREIAIEDSDNAGLLHDKLMNLGSEAVVETLRLISTTEIQPQVQPAEELKTAYKLNRDNCKINWNQSAVQVHNHIRGLNPQPAAWTLFKDGDQEWSVKIFETAMLLQAHEESIGTISTTKKEMKIAVADGYIQILSLQFPGKKQMKTADLLNGVQFSPAAKAE